MTTPTFTEVFAAILQTELQYTRDGENTAAVTLHRLGLRLIKGKVTPAWVVANFKLMEEER